MPAQNLLIVMRAVLRPAIRMMDAVLGRLPQGDGHVQGSNRQVALHAVADCPADHTTGMQVQNDGCLLYTSDAADE